MRTVCFAALLSLCVSQSGPQLSSSTAFVVFPQDCNANPPMAFGGKLLSEMDRCAGITTRRFLYSSTVRDAVTVAINHVRFHKAAEIKDLVVVTGTVVGAGEKSITVRVTVERELAAGRELLVEGEFIFCAYDLAARRAAPHGLVLPSVGPSIGK
jgi:acyl-CoA hydrolase